LHRLRIEIPDPTDVPPPTEAAVVYLMPPAATFPGETAPIRMTGKMMCWQRAAMHDTPRTTRPMHNRWTTRGMRRGPCGLDRRLARPRRRSLMRLARLLGMRRQCKPRYQRDQWKDDPRSTGRVHSRKPLLAMPFCQCGPAKRSKPHFASIDD